MPDEPSELDRLALGPDAAYAERAPRPSRTPRRRKGEQELSLDTDLKAMPAALRKGALAMSARILARRIDAAVAAGMTDSTRDASGLHREFRMHWETLTAMAPGERKGDATDEKRERIERNRLRVVGGEE